MVAVAEAAIGGAYAPGALGAALDLTGYAPGIPAEGVLYGEDGARAVVSAAPADLEALLALAAQHQVPARRAGRVGQAGSALELRLGSQVFSWGISALRKTYFEAIPGRMRHPDVDRSAGE